VASFTTYCGGWQLPSELDTQDTGAEPADGTGPLPRPNLKLTGVFSLVVLAGLAVGWLLSEPADSAPDVANVGEPAPDFDVPLLDGGRFVLSEQLASEDRPVVLNLWASWCGPCRVETPDISAFAEANPDVKVIGVAVEDTVSGADAFAEEFAPVYDLAFGTDKFDAAYPRLGLPATYVIGPDGVIDQLFNGIVNEDVLEGLVSS
jgi:cytochrome c biogenesis protein CcmG/thiol:disulfide interchange protein DsbE